MDRRVRSRCSTAIGDAVSLVAACLLASLAWAATGSPAGAKTSKPESVAEPPEFTIKSYLGRCLNAAAPIVTHVPGHQPTPPPPLAIADCDGSVRQQFGVVEVDAAHHVRIKGAGLCVTAASATEGAAVALAPCADTPLQVFDLDGDSIILDSDWDLVVEVKDSLTTAGTPLALGKRFTNDNELFDFTSLANPPVEPTTGFKTVTDANGLVNALTSPQQPNTVIQIPPDMLITFKDLPAVCGPNNNETCDWLNIPEGVTLRGDRRSVLEGPQVSITQGHTGRADADPGAFIMQAPRTRITGLRIRGPGRDPHGTKPAMNGVTMIVTSGGQANSELVDHNDISDWGVAAINLRGAFPSNPNACPLMPESPQDAHIIRNFIHDNMQNHSGASEGYGVVASWGSYPLIFANTFQKNVHSITQDSSPLSGYLAVDNIFLSGNASVDTDVHGSNSSGNHDGGIAGMGAQLIGNSFLRNDGQGGDLEHANFSLRGIPCSGVPALFVGNATEQSATDAVIVIPSDGSSGGSTIPWYMASPGAPLQCSCPQSPSPRALCACPAPLPPARPRVPYVRVDSKFSIPDPTQTFLVGDFDGLGFNDVFMATGAGWYYSPGGNAEWRFLSSKTETADALLIGDFSGLGRPADVFKQVGDDWYVSWGGRSDWKLLSSGHRVNMSPSTSPDRGVIDYVIGNFVSSDRSDVFLADGQTWWVSAGGVAPFETYVAGSSFRRQDLAFGRFDSSGMTEVAGVVDNQWMFVPSEGPRHWTPLRAKLSNTMGGTYAADFNGDGIADIALDRGGDWGVSLSARGDFQKVDGLSQLPNAIAIGHFRPDHPGADALIWFGNAFYLTSYFDPNPVQQSRQDMR